MKAGHSGHGTIQKALRDIECAWEAMKNTPVQMTAEEFENKLLRQARRHGTPYSTAIGGWLSTAKRVIADPHTKQSTKNLYLSEADPAELKPVLRKFYKAFNSLSLFAEWSYQDLVSFLNDPKKDKGLKAFLYWRALPVAEAFHRYSQMKLRGSKAKQFYLTTRPAVVFRCK